MQGEQFRCSRCDDWKVLAEFPPSKAKNKAQWCRQCLREDQRRRKGLAAHEHEIICEWCGSSKSVTDSRSKFCSRKCKDLAKNRARQDAIDATKPERACQWCGADIPKTMRVDARFCSSDCNSLAHRTTRNYRRRMGAGAPLKPRKEPLVNFADIAIRDGWRCRLCGGKVSRTKSHPDAMCASLDHITPLAEGGTNDHTNLQLTHLRCNLSKRATAAGEQMFLL